MERLSATGTVRQTKPAKRWNEQRGKARRGESVAGVPGEQFSDLNGVGGRSFPQIV
jgi:hypothetical protein